MACALTKEQVLDLYEVTYGELYDRMEDERLSAFDINALIREVYSQINEATQDPNKALQYAQALPEVFELVARDPEIRKYLRQELKFSFDKLADLIIDFEDLEKVKSFVETPKKSVKEIKKEIKEIQKRAPEGKEAPADPTILWSWNEDHGAKVTSPLITTTQTALAQNPETVSEADRNKRDPEKRLFDDVIKDIAYIARKRTADTDEIMYGDVSIALTAMSDRTFPYEFLTTDDKEFLRNNPSYKDGIVSVITDTDGNIVFFTENGEITTDPKKGRAVYTYLRRVNVIGDKLYLSSRSNRYTTLVDPEVLAKREAERLKALGVEITDEQLEMMTKEIAEKQENEMNSLYRLREMINNDKNLTVTLPITNGSFGIPKSNVQTVSLAESGLSEEDITKYEIVESGPLSGYAFFTVQKERPGATIDQDVFLQRGDTTQELANKVAAVLTTKAKLKGKELTPQERKDYFEVFYDNSIPEKQRTNRNGIVAKVKYKDNVPYLEVAIDGKPIPQEILYTEDGATLIADKLMNAVKKGTKVYPANVHYNNKYRGGSFTDYSVEGDVVTSKKVEHFTFIKPFVKIAYMSEENAYFNGLNAYLNFAIPNEILPSGERVYEVGMPVPKKAEKKKEEEKKKAKNVTPNKSNKATVNNFDKYGEAKEAANNGEGVWVMRPAYGLETDITFLENFGNPWDVKADKLNEKVKIVDSVDIAVKNYEDWLRGKKFKNVDPKRRAWILDQIESGALDGVVFINYKPGKQKSHADVLVKMINNRNKETVSKKPQSERVKTTPEQKKQMDKKILAVPSVDDILNAPTKGLFKRSKAYDSFMDRMFTSKADIKRAEDWWSNSPLSKHIKLTRITEIVNSDAFATWMGYGITLYEADGGTMIDVYHEAWHGFSQLFLTKIEKERLYESIRKLPKYADMEFYDIEEMLAEGFRDYAKSNGRIEAPIKEASSIFAKIWNFLKSLFGKVTKKEMVTDFTDIPKVKELYDKLYRASEKPEILANLKPSMQNMMFTKMDRSKTIQPLKSMAKNYKEFSVEESMRAVNSIDNIIASIFQNYNRDHQTTVGSTKILNEPTNRINLYAQVKKTIQALADRFQEEHAVLALENNEKRDNDTITADEEAAEIELFEKVVYLNKIIDNYGDIELALDGKQKTGVVAYHIKKSKFTVLKESYSEIEDASDITQSRAFLNDGTNKVSSKELASEETMMLLSSIFKVTRDKKGNLVEERDDLGIRQLQDVDITWNRLAKILEGSFDEQEMYKRIVENSYNYPELYQLQNLLPNPTLSTYADNTQFDAETKFWQDLKKPRIPYIQLNIHKKKDEKKSSFESRLARANFDTFQVVSDWQANFAASDPVTNRYITRDIDTNQKLLDIDEIVKTIPFKNGFLTPDDAIKFLEAIGIQLDMSSPAIQEIVYNKELKFSSTFGINRMYQTLIEVNKKKNLPEAAEFRSKPLFYLINGLPEALRTNKEEDEDVQGRVRVLAEIQNMYADKYSNFSVQNPQGNRVWEHFVDNTITRVITSINHADSWFQLTGQEGHDPNGIFKHMYWLGEQNNPLSEFSVLLKSVFDFETGEKKEGATLQLQNVAGTQLVVGRNSEGEVTSSMDATGKFLQELHTMLLNGVEEFMRHASKNMAMGVTATEIETYPSKRSKKLYIDVDAFIPGSFGETKGVEIMTGYLSGEANRIFRFKSDPKYKNYAGYNRDVIRKDGKEVMAGEAFTAFDDVLSLEVQKELYAIIDKAVKDKEVDFNMWDIIMEDEDLAMRIEKDIIKYFEAETKENLDRLRKAKYVDQGLRDKLVKPGLKLSAKEQEEILVKAYSYNSWIHKFETAIIAYGDVVQYNHEKEEFHKRNAGLGSGGRGFRSDLRAQAFINGPLFEKVYAKRMGYKTRAYDGTFHTAILKEIKMGSAYIEEYQEILEQEYFERLGDKAEAKRLAKIAIDEYSSMKIADGQGHITFEAYRMFKKLEGNWTDAQERLYRRVARGENISMSDVIEYFPPYKVQYYGNIQAEGLAVTSFHKFSLAPIIPGVAKEGTRLYDLHMLMMDKQIDYVTFETGSKVGHIGGGDNIFNEDGSINKDSEFTTNVVFAEYLKNQTEVNSKFKHKSIFSTQMRKLILEGLYEQGRIATKDEDKITDPIIKRYLKNVSDYTELLKLELLEEIGFEQNADGEYVPVNKDSLEKLADLIRDNLEKEDVISDELLDFIEVDNHGNLVHDLSLHPESAKIEKLLLSMINKRIIKQKVKGEPLVQVSSALYEGSFGIEGDFKKATSADRKKWMGTNLLPTYHRMKDGKTAAMKVMIAMQGDYENLFNLEYENGETVGVYDEDGNIDMEGSLARLNEKIKDDAWLDANNKANRKAITMVGVRIPVQGLNSMEFMEVYHFLPPQAGNIIIPPAEIVAKSGGDFDIDKLTIFMTNIDSSGKLKEKQFESTEWIKERVKELKENGESTYQLFAEQKAGLENELIEDIRNILELPQNYASLITPNGTFLLKHIAEDLSEDVMDYDPFKNRMSDTYNVNKDGKKVISPTRIFEAGYNIYKHESNIVGKKTLGLGAVENTFNVIMNAAGAFMPRMFTNPNDPKDVREGFLYLRHNKMLDPEGNEVISISNRYDIDKKNKIADVISQMMNGWVDVEKDAWIFFIQGNYEVAPILLYLAKAGVPIDEAIYFVSNPLVRDYVNEQRLAKSTFAEVLGKKPDLPAFAKYQASSNVIGKFFKPEELKMFSKNTERYKKGIELAKEVFSETGQETFDKDQMRELIRAFKKGDMTESQEKMAKAMFLHFLHIEQQIAGITQLKMNMNPDTSTDSTLSDVEQTEANLENLENDTRIPSELLNSLRYDSVISSFFNGELALAISKPIFKLRYHKVISDYLISRNATIRTDAATTFGEGQRDRFISTFRNDIVSFIFQNALRRYKISDEYKSYDIETKIPVALVRELKRGAFAKTNADGTKTLYIDLKQLEKEFKSKAWVKDSDAENNYHDRGLFALDESTFMRNGGRNFNQYLRFVAEREFLRSENPLAEVSKTKRFKAEVAEVTRNNSEISNEKAVRYVYERYLAHKALDNTYNIDHMFVNRETALAVRINNVIAENPDLVKKYNVLSRLNLDTDRDKTIFNLYLSDKDIDTNKATRYTRQLAALADRSVQKVADPEENQRISDLFKLLNMYSYMQTGLNKTKLNFTAITDFSPFVSIVEEESKKFQDALDVNGFAILDEFYKLFMHQNDKDNPTKTRFKDYLSTIDYTNEAKVKGMKVITTSKRDPRTQAAGAPVEVEPNYYTPELLQANPDKIYVFGDNNERKGKKGQAAIRDEANAMGISTKLRPSADEDAFMTDKDFASNKAVINSDIAKIKATGKTIVFPKDGLGTGLAALKTKAPKTYAYLKQRLLEEFGFNNDTGEVTVQTVTDTEAGEATPFRRYGLSIQPNENFYTYNDSGRKTGYYERIASENNDVVFIYNTSTAEIKSEFIKSFGGQSNFANYAEDMSINIPTSMDKAGDNFVNLDPSKYDSLKNLWERRIQSIKDLMAKDILVAFPETGFGDPNIMPEELFVYLSKRLFEEFGYVNPGSTIFEQIKEIVVLPQGITDEEILAQLGLEEDPFKC